MRINLFQCSWFCLSPLQGPLCVEGRLGRRKNESARGTWDTRREAQSVKETVGPFRSIQPKTFENLETAANGTDIFQKSFQKSWKLLNFQNANYSTKNSRNCGKKVKWKENFQEISENLSIPREVVLFFGNFAKCCSIRY